MLLILKSNPDPFPLYNTSNSL